MAGAGRSLMGWKDWKTEAGLLEASQTMVPSLDFILRPQEVFGGL